MKDIAVYKKIKTNVKKPTYNTTYKIISSIAKHSYKYNQTMKEAIEECFKTNYFNYITSEEMLNFMIELDPQFMKAFMSSTNTKRLQLCVLLERYKFKLIEFIEKG